MGLDMYLGRVKKNNILTLKEMNKLDLDECQANNKELFQKLIDEDIIHEHGSSYKYYSFREEVGYWRKANSIHNWFVENVQDGIDECQTVEVPKEQLEELFEICKEVLEETILVDGKVHNGYTFDGEGNKVFNFEDGKVVEDSSIAEELLPCREGFFFGDNQYNEYYLEDVRETISILETVLKETNFDTHYIVYQSSW